MTGRAELVAAATVGTSHRAFDLTLLPEPLRPGEIPGNAAERLLAAAALSALARRTGPPTAPAPTTPTPAVHERLPVVPDVIRQVVGRFGEHPNLLLEALTLIHLAGLRLPPEAVPGLLDDPRPGVLAATRPVAGEIGRLLVAMNPRWSAAVEPDPTDRSVWDDGTVAQRTAWLRGLRRVDPAAARELLADGFSRETAGTRAELLAVLAGGLSDADQDFLLAAAVDRGRSVVTVAIDLLRRLPGSPLVRDMRALAGRSLTVQRRALRRTLTVTEPTPADFAPWPASDSDPWTALLSRLDPADWPQIFGVDLLPLIAARTVELHPLWPGFREAAVTFRHAGLAAVLVGAMHARGGGKTTVTVDPELWAVLDPAAAIAALDRLLGDRQVRADQVAIAANTVTRPWPAAMARRFARWLPAAAGPGLPARRPLWDLWVAGVALPDCRELADVARSLAVDAAGDQGPALRTRAGQAANLLTLRAVLYETLRPTDDHRPSGGKP